MARYVIGDIHGCADETQRLIDTLPLARGDRLVFLGDYIDRGPDSRGVVSYLLSLQQHHEEIDFVFLKGNHEDMLLSYLGLSGRHGDMFLINGGKATLAESDLVKLFVTYSMPTSTLSGWTVNAVEASSFGETWAIVAYAICATVSS